MNIDIWDNKVYSTKELRTKMAQRLSEFRLKIRHFEYLLAQMEVMIEDYIDVEESRTKGE